MRARVRLLYSCLWCRQLFEPRERGQRFHSPRCYWRAKRRVPGERWCAVCDGRFFVGGTDRRGRRRPDMRQRYCSKRCASRAREAQRALRMDASRLHPAARGALGAAVDGEGHVNVVARYFEIGNTNVRWLRGLRAICAGAGSIRPDRKRRRPNWKIVWRWRVYDGTAAALLAQCLPHLLIKRMKAERLIAYYARRAAIADGVRAVGNRRRRTVGGFVMANLRRRAGS